MKNCERFEIQVSSWLDDELDRADQIEMTDHLVRCAGCRGFYREARALEGLVAVVRKPGRSAAPSQELWSKIETSAGRRGKVLAFRQRIRTRAWQAAAAVVLAVGLGLVLLNGPGTPTLETASIDVQLGSGSGEMTEARFVELTTEMLRAEPRYRNALFQVMQQVVRETGVQEASLDNFMVDEGTQDASRAESLRRNPA